MKKNEVLSQWEAELELNNWWSTLLGGQTTDTDPSLFSLEPPKNILPKSDTYAAEAMHDRLSEYLSYVRKEDTWYVWTGKIHAPMDDDDFTTDIATLFYKAMVKAMEVIKTMLDARAGEMKSEGASEEDVKKVRDLYKIFGEHKKYRDRISDYHGKTALVNEMKRQFAVAPDHYSDDRRWFVVENGVFDMEAVRRDRRFDLLPHNSTRPVYRMFPAEYDPSAEYPALRHFLSTSIPDETQAGYLSKAIAWAFLEGPEATRTVISIQGAPSSGKSMIQSCFRKLAPDFVASPPDDAITAHGKNPKHARYDMRNARLSMFSEVRRRIDHTFLLEYSGGDPLAVERKYENGRTYTPQGIILIANNEPLDVDKSDPAMLDRLSIVSFPHSFNVADPEHTLDRELGASIVSQGSGFLNWLTGSYLAFLEHGLDRSDSMMQALSDEAVDEDTVKAFLDDRMDGGVYVNTPGLAVSKYVKWTHLHVEYVDYSWNHNVPRFQILEPLAFKKRLEALGWSIEKSNGYRVVGLRDERNGANTG